MKLFAAVIVALTAKTSFAISFDTSSVDGNSVTDLKRVNTAFVPYGPDLTSSPPQAADDTEPWNGYGYGVGAAEHVALDGKEGYLYVQGEAGVRIHM